MQYHLAQLNIAHMKAPLDDPVMKRFVDWLELINGHADKSPGFIWRLQSDEGDATSIRAFDDDLILINISIWESLEALKRYVIDSDHVQVIRELAYWFVPMNSATTVLWWPKGHSPTIEEAKERLTVAIFTTGASCERNRKCGRVAEPVGVVPLARSPREPGATLGAVSAQWIH